MTELPLLLSGPVLRHTSATELNFWLCTSRACSIEITLYPPGQSPHTYKPQTQQIPAGKHCFIQLVHLPVAQALPTDCYIGYDFIFDGDSSTPLKAHLPNLCYGTDERPGFSIRPTIHSLLHGSCRKPHHPGEDGLLSADSHLAQARHSDKGPAMLLLTGDQIYADDVAGPMLSAIGQLIEALGLWSETFAGAIVNNARELVHSEHNYYERDQLLPRNKANRDLLELFFSGAEKPIFTSAGADNHLITFSEVLAMYLLSWSPCCWALVDTERVPDGVKAPYRERYQNERTIIAEFARGLDQVQRLLAHIPSYMIFDDHDITDDWNLTRGWEETAYGHPFSRRIIGNALIGYWLCQGWGNQPKALEPLAEHINHHFSAGELHNQDALIDRLLEWEHWHYELPTEPPVVVLDTRTRRWRSESSPNRPSGLMDWEALTDMQQKLIGHPSVILVSPSPVFGVKLIEVVQRVFTFFGKALMVDAENWMAHPGAANVMLNIFSHPKTPPHFIILSGDVHYSFVYNVSLRRRKHSPEITQITASGIKNTFPQTLLTWFDRLNRWLYASRSPLNIFTKRRRMKVRQRRVEGQSHARLLNQSGIGLVTLENNADDVKASILSGESNAQDFY
ncbi:alkaline phosphatase family protein [Gilvimarinus xylanilyticus]|uniref:Alkaline phosphatase family protein n=1 Tax=Gilvimarinus xylanilyticus TaxID=2944139 RepID=A0A9X2HSM9_9GAMM|nr:alkaline phosphatase family protein [Gilvimarinus xylanilyticus]MCP8897813.1 alkaline phosphatase family protein [Gilvimarinus xylanilyticus]